MVSEVDKYVIDKVKERRTEKGMSQADLAFEIDVPTSFIAMIESGQYSKKYNVQHINNIAKALECSPRDFLPKNPF